MKEGREHRRSFWLCRKLSIGDTPKRTLRIFQLASQRELHPLLDEHLQFLGTPTSAGVLRPPLAKETSEAQVGRDDAMAWDEGREGIVAERGPDWDA